MHRSAAMVSGRTKSKTCPHCNNHFHCLCQPGIRKINRGPGLDPSCKASRAIQIQDMFINTKEGRHWRRSGQPWRPRNYSLCARAGRSSTRQAGQVKTSCADWRPRLPPCSAMIVVARRQSLVAQVRLAPSAQATLSERPAQSGSAGDTCTTTARFDRAHKVAASASTSQVSATGSPSTDKLRWSAAGSDQGPVAAHSAAVRSNQTGSTDGCARGVSARR